MMQDVQPEARGLEPGDLVFLDDEGPLMTVGHVAEEAGVVGVVFFDPDGNVHRGAYSAERLTKADPAVHQALNVLGSHYMIIRIPGPAVP